MKKLLFSIIATVFITSVSFAQTKTENSNQDKGKKGWWCRKFTVTLGGPYASIATDVIICIQNNGYGGPNITIEKDGSEHMIGYIKTNELIENCGGKISSKDIGSTIVTKISPEEIEGKKWAVKQEKNKIMTLEDETYLEVILEQKK